MTGSDSGALPAADGDAERARILDGVLDALEMPRSGIRRWMEQGKDWCEAHGGQRRYAEVMRIYQACLDALDRGRPEVRCGESARPGVSGGRDAGQGPAGNVVATGSAASGKSPTNGETGAHVQYDGLARRTGGQ